MLVINGKKLDVNDRSDPFVKLYKSQINILNKLGKEHFVFTFPDKMIRQVEDEHGNLRDEHSQGSLIKFRQKYVTYKLGEFDVVYYKTSFFDKNGTENFRPRMWDFKGPFVTLKWETNKDLIWWLVFVCPYIEKLDFIEGEYSQNLDRGRVAFKLEDKVRRRASEYDEQKLYLDAMTAIFDPEAGLRGDQLIYVAKNYGVPCEALGDNDKAIRAELGAKVLVFKKGGKYDMNKIGEFLNIIPKEKGARLKQNVVSMAVVNDLISLNMIQSRQVGDKYGWISLNSNEVIMTHHPNDNAKDALMDWLTKNVPIRDGFEKRIQEKKREEEAKLKELNEQTDE